MALAENMKRSDKEALANMETLRKNPYPGRGIVMGLNETGDMALQVYWITARSDHSRNRILVTEGDTFKTDAFDWDKVDDPSLIIYYAMRKVGNQHIVSNGDQTDTIAELLENGKTWKDAVETWNYEPDELSTPRISGVLTIGENPDFNLSIIKRGNGETSLRIYSHPTGRIRPGIGYCIHTYEGEDENNPRSFSGTPYPLLLEGKDVREIAKTYWNLLRPINRGSNDNRVALVVKGVDLKTGEVDYKIQNALGDDSPSSVRFKA